VALHFIGFVDVVTFVGVISLSLLLGGAATSLSIKLAHKFKVLAMPSARGSHQVPTPRLGGFGYFVPLTAIVAVVLLKPDVLGFDPQMVGMPPDLGTLLPLIIVCGSLAFFIGLMDDILRLPVAFKLFGQIICAALFIYLGNQIAYEFVLTETPPNPGRVAMQGERAFERGAGFANVALTRSVVLDEAWAGFTARLGKFAAHIPPLAVIVTFLWIIAVMNAYNFMDGIDGLAATFFITVAVGLFAVYVPEYFEPPPPMFIFHGGPLMLLATTLIGLSLGFLFYNWPPASTFLGDCGSQYVGFLVPAILAQVTRPTSKWLFQLDRIGANTNTAVAEFAYVDFLAVVILVFPFLYDVTYTLARRLFRGKPIWRAHHEHLYQRLIDLGWSHRGVVLFSLPFYIAHAVIFFAYCWAPTERWRWICAALALLPMIVYTLTVIVSEQRSRPRQQTGC